MLVGCGEKEETGWPSCFVAGTEVQTPRGPVAIESLEPGDVVFSWSIDAGRPVPRRVIHTLVRTAPATWTLDLGETSLEVTGEHPVYSLSEERWVPVHELLPGDAVAQWRDGAVRPASIRAMERGDGAVTVFNLSVEGPEHDFFADGVLVHNKQLATGTWYTTPTSGSSTPSSPDAFEVTVRWIDDGSEPIDTDGDGLPDSQCGDRVEIEIFDPLDIQQWEFGIAETGVTGGWTGEDCLSGYGGYSYCHPIGPTHALDQVTTCDPADVEEGSTTAMHAGLDPRSTCTLRDSLDACFVFGADPAYYATLGCDELFRLHGCATFPSP